MILLDTHIWIWWVQGDSRLDPAHRTLLDTPSSQRLGISAYSGWEAVKLSERGRIVLPLPIGPWLRQATSHPRLDVVPLTIDIAIAVGELPPGMHRDPADQIIVATARNLGCPLLTYDRLIRAYPHVQLQP